jgi:hypothetical protein
MVAHSLRNITLLLYFRKYWPKNFDFSLGIARQVVALIIQPHLASSFNTSRSTPLVPIRATDVTIRCDLYLYLGNLCLQHKQIQMLA